MKNTNGFWMLELWQKGDGQFWRPFAQYSDNSIALSDQQYFEYKEGTPCRLVFILFTEYGPVPHKSAGILNTEEAQERRRENYQRQQQESLDVIHKDQA